MTTETPLCIGCRHLRTRVGKFPAASGARREIETHHCLRQRSPVSGEVLKADPEKARRADGMCGPQGLFYEPKGDPQ